MVETVAVLILQPQQFTNATGNLMFAISSFIINPDVLYFNRRLTITDIWKETASKRMQPYIRLQPNHLL